MKGRKKRPIPQGWASADEVAALQQVAYTDLNVTQASSLDTESDYAAVGGLDGKLDIYSVQANTVERTLDVGEPITSTVWTGSKVIVGTAKGSVKVLDGGRETASFATHAGAVTGLAVHPGGRILASVGVDKSYVLYDLEALEKVSRVYTDAGTFIARQSYNNNGTMLTDHACSPHSLRLPPGRQSIRCRHAIGSHQDLQDRHGRAGRVLPAGLACSVSRLLGEWFLVRGFGQGPNHHNHFRSPQVRRRRPGPRAHDGRGARAGMGLHRPVPCHGGLAGHYGAAVHQELQAVVGAAADEQRSRGVAVGSGGQDAGGGE
jgi:hypothetical protein